MTPFSGTVSERAEVMPTADEVLNYARIRTAILEGWARGEAITEMKIPAGLRKNAAGEYLAPTTLYAYARRIYRDLDVNTAAAAVAEGIRRGFLPCPCNEPMRASDVRRHAQKGAP